MLIPHLYFSLLFYKQMKVSHNLWVSSKLLISCMSPNNSCSKQQNFEIVSLFPWELMLKICLPTFLVYWSKWEVLFFEGSLSLMKYHFLMTQTLLWSLLSFPLLTSLRWVCQQGEAFSKFFIWEVLKHSCNLLPLTYWRPQRFDELNLQRVVEFLILKRLIHFLFKIYLLIE